MERVSDWQRRKYDAGFGALSWPVEMGGAGLTTSHDVVFAQEESHFQVPAPHELASVTLHLVAPTLRLFGTEEVRTKYLTPFLRGDAQCCQLFSEPSAGSDLAGLGTRATRDGDDWVVNGQKVWSSGAQFADFGRADRPLGPERSQARWVDGLSVAARPARCGGPAVEADVRRPLVLRGVPHRRAGPRLDAAGGGRGGLEGGSDDARVRTRAQRDHPDASVAAGDSCCRWLESSAVTMIRWCASGLPTCGSSRRCCSSQPSGTTRRRLAGQDPGPISSLRKLHWVRRPDTGLGGGRRHTRPATGRGHRRVGHVRVDRAPARCSGLPDRRRQ